MRRRVVKYVALAVLVPVASRLAARAADAMERRNGPSVATRGIRAGGSLIGRRGRW